MIQKPLVTATYLFEYPPLSGSGHTLKRYGYPFTWQWRSNKSIILWSMKLNHWQIQSIVSWCVTEHSEFPRFHQATSLETYIWQMLPQRLCVISRICRILASCNVTQRNSWNSECSLMCMCATFTIINHHQIDNADDSCWCMCARVYAQNVYVLVKKIGTYCRISTHMYIEFVLWVICLTGYYKEIKQEVLHSGWVTSYSLITPTCLAGICPSKTVHIQCLYSCASVCADCEWMWWSYVHFHR